MAVQPRGKVPRREDPEWTGDFEKLYETIGERQVSCLLSGRIIDLGHAIRRRHDDLTHLLTWATRDEFGGQQTPGQGQALTPGAAASLTDADIQILEVLSKTAKKIGWKELAPLMRGKLSRRTVSEYGLQLGAAGADR